jgi:DNA-binding transcriptional ArsR family regulator
LVSVADQVPVRDLDERSWLKAISHPVRMRLLALLENEPASPKSLADRLALPLGTIAYHVRTLSKLGFLELVDTKQRRGAVEHYYRAKEHPPVDGNAWTDPDVTVKRRLLVRALGEAYAHSFSATTAGGFDRADAHLSRTLFRLDEEGWTKLAAASRRWFVEAAAIEAESRERPSGDDEPLDAELVMLLFEQVQSAAAVGAVSD